MDLNFKEEQRSNVNSYPCNTSFESQLILEPVYNPLCPHILQLSGTTLHVENSLSESYKPTQTRPGRSVKTGLRRFKANARERQRMHGLNGALDKLRRCIPLISEKQTLSKIETLRLARNYISLLKNVLKESSENPYEPWTVANFLTLGLSTATANVIKSLLGLDMRSSLFLMPHKNSPGQLRTTTLRRSQIAEHFRLNETTLDLIKNPEKLRDSKNQVGSKPMLNDELDADNILLETLISELPSFSDDWVPSFGVQTDHFNLV